MQFSTRLGDTAAASYPLPLHGEALWQEGERHQESTLTWKTSIELPAVPFGHIIVPSFASTREYAGHAFTLIEPVVCGLQEVPAVKPAPAADTNSPVTAHIDCWHTRARLRSAVVQLTVESPEPPEAYLITLTIRPLNVLRPAMPTSSIGCGRALTPVSQMTYEGDIRGRICSPTALTMALSYLDDPPSLQSIVEACYDPATKAYGAWPLAISAAAGRGILGAVEAVTSWDEIGDVLSAGSPIVCSIRFRTGSLRGAPLRQTAGHLVVLTSADREEVEVYDPAAENDEQVLRRYNTREFSRAWLARRGAAYFFAPGN